MHWSHVCLLTLVLASFPVTQGRRGGGKHTKPSSKFSKAANTSYTSGGKGNGGGAKEEDSTPLAIRLEAAVIKFQVRKRGNKVRNKKLRGKNPATSDWPQLQSGQFAMSCFLPLRLSCRHFDLQTRRSVDLMRRTEIVQF